MRYLTGVKGDDEPDPSQTARHAGRVETEDRRSIQTAARAWMRSGSWSTWMEGRSRCGARWLVGGTGGGGTGGLVGAGVWAVENLITVEP